MKYYVYSIHSNPCNNAKGKALHSWLKEKLEDTMIEADFMEDCCHVSKQKCMR